MDPLFRYFAGSLGLFVQGKSKGKDTHDCIWENFNGATWEVVHITSP